jgi:RNA polymerase sigma-70 factor (ECF subfamily)
VAEVPGHPEGAPVTAQAERDSQLLKEIAAGDRTAFTTLYRRYHRRLFGFIYRRLEDQEAAEDVLQEVMFEVWKKAGSFAGRSKPSTWLFGIARYKTLNALRASGRPSAPGEEMAEFADESAGPEERAAAGSQREAVQAALGRLSPEHREALELTYYEGLSLAEVAEIVGVPPGTVKSRLFHARQHLKGLLTRRGLE